MENVRANELRLVWDPPTSDGDLPLRPWPSMRNRRNRSNKSRLGSNEAKAHVVTWCHVANACNLFEVATGLRSALNVGFLFICWCKTDRSLLPISRPGSHNMVDVFLQEACQATWMSRGEWVQMLRWAKSNFFLLKYLRTKCFIDGIVRGWHSKVRVE